MTNLHGPSQSGELNELSLTTKVSSSVYWGPFAWPILPLSALGLWFIVTSDSSTIEPLILFLLLIPATLWRLFQSRQDIKRIQQYLRDRGSVLLYISYDPFGAGWFGERNSTLYFVKVIDRKGKQYKATCKTGWFTGVYFTEG
jgi:hypothetical protein